MSAQGTGEGTAATSVVDVVRTHRLEVVDDEGGVRVLVGRLGDGEGPVYGIAVHAGDASTGVHVTADDGSAGVTLARRGDGIVDCRAFAGEGEGEGEVAGAVDFGTREPLLSIEVAPDGTVTLRLGDARLTP